MFGGIETGGNLGGPWPIGGGGKPMGGIPEDEG